MVLAIHLYWFPYTRVFTKKINKFDFVVDKSDTIVREYIINN